MMKVTLTHIGVVALGRLFAIWSFVIGVILLIISGIIILFGTLLGMVAGDNPIEALGGGIIGFIGFLFFGVVGLVINSVIAFLLGALSALVYNIVIKVGGGIDFDLKERS